MMGFRQSIFVAPAVGNLPLTLRISIVPAVDAQQREVAAYLPLGHYLPGVDPAAFANQDAPRVSWYAGYEPRPGNKMTTDIHGAPVWTGPVGEGARAWQLLLSEGPSAVAAYLVDLYGQVFGDTPGRVIVEPANRYSGAVGL